MLIMGIGLDYSDTFRNHPCPTQNTTEKNYTLCFVACTILTLASLAVATQFKFSSTHQEHRPDEVGGLVMDTRMGLFQALSGLIPIFKRKLILQ